MRGLLDTFVQHSMNYANFFLSAEVHKSTLCLRCFYWQTHNHRSTVFTFDISSFRECIEKCGETFRNTNYYFNLITATITLYECLISLHQYLSELTLMPLWLAKKIQLSILRWYPSARKIYVGNELVYSKFLSFSRREYYRLDVWKTFENYIEKETALISDLRVTRISMLSTLKSIQEELLIVNKHEYLTMLRAQMSQFKPQSNYQNLKRLKSYKNHC